MSNRARLKQIIKAGFLILVIPLYLLYRVIRPLGGIDATFQSFSQLISIIPGKIGIYVRAAFYRLACPNTSDEVSVGFLTIFSHHDTTISEGVYIGPQCNIGKCEIGQNTLIGSGVHILSGNKQHDFSDPDTPIKDQKGQYRKITIHEDCWIGNSSIIMNDIESRAVIAAGSVVTKKVPANSILAGNPAKPLKQTL